MMENRLKPLNDFIFKKLFGEQSCVEELRALLNAILNTNDTNKLVSLELVENLELTKEMMEDKTGRLDVKAQTADGMKLNIEVQLTNQHNMDKRTLFYWGKLFLEGIKKGQDYINLNKVITINLLNFEFLEIDKYHSQYHLWEDEEKYLLTDIVEIHMIELPKFRKYEHKDMNVPLQRWLKFFEPDIGEDELKELMEMDESLKVVEKKLERLSSDKKTIALYEAREAALHERANMISSAKAEGRVEERIAVAESMISLGLENDIIEKSTGINQSEIDELRKKSQKH